MGKFRTDSEIERGLASVARDVPMPDGSTRTVTLFQVAWDAFDFMTTEGAPWSIDAPRFSEWALVNQAEVGGSFEENFNSVISYAHRRFNHGEKARNKGWIR